MIITEKDSLLSSQKWYIKFSEKNRWFVDSGFVKNMWWTRYKNLIFIASTVSSKMLGAMAKKEGLTFVETLTGFKWMANEASDLESLTGKDIFRSSLCIYNFYIEAGQF